MGSNQVPLASAAGYSTVETLLDEAASNLRRYSRGSSGQRVSGSMRVAKSNSTNHSPRGAVALSRRRTVMTDKRRIATADQKSGGMGSQDGLHILPKSNRPVSWHTSSYIEPQPSHHLSYPMPYLSTPNESCIFDLPLTPVAYSSYASPSTSFSPFSVPFAGYDERYTYLDYSDPYASSRSYAQEGQGGSEQFDHSSYGTDATLYPQLDWSNFAANRFEISTAPPTPETFLPIQHPDPAFPSEDSIPYHSLSDSAQEDGGEILCGLGLYDSPDAGKYGAYDPQLDNYRSSMSQLLGPAYRREPMGKGLKLEETWKPPPSDDEDVDNVEDQDGEGDEDEDNVAEVGILGPIKTPITTIQDSSCTGSTPPDINNDCINWL